MRTSHLVLAAVFGILLIGSGVGMLFVNARPRTQVAAVPIATHAPTAVPTVAATVTPRPPTPTPRPPSPTPDPDAVTFQTSSLASEFSLVGTVTGTYTIHRDAIDVTIREGEVHFDFTKQADPDTVFVAIQAGSAYTTDDGQWDIDAISIPVPVRVEPTPKGSYRLHDMTFRIPRTVIQQDKPHWLLFQLVELYKDTSRPYIENDYTNIAYCYIHDDNHPFQFPARSSV